MALPPDVQMVEVSIGQLVDAGLSTSFTGTGYVLPSIAVTHIASATLVPAVETSFAIVGGRGVITLIATNALGFSASNWTYRFRFEVSGPGGAPVTIPNKTVLLPAEVPQVDFEVLATATGAYDLVQMPAVLAVAGLTGTVDAHQLATALAPHLGITDAGAVTGPTGPAGEVGPAGPSNSLTIGTVVTGTPAAATITGTAPSQVLNLTLPDPGSSTLTMGTVTTGAAGSSAAATIASGVLNLTIPRGNTGSTGATGAAGPANSLTIGTVSTGTAGASITGTAPSQVLNLTLPAGPTGPAGPAGTIAAFGPNWVAAVDAPSAIKTLVTAAGGAVCDGVADEVQINAALTTYRAVCLTEGTFTIAAPVTPPARRQLQGAGSSATVLAAAAGLAGAGISITGAKDHITIRDLAWDGNGIGAVNGIEANISSATGFWTGAEANLIFESIVIRNATGIGVSMQGAFNRDCKIRNVHVYNASGAGWYLNCPDGSLDQCISGSSGGHGFHLDSGASNWRLSNCKAWYADMDGFRVGPSNARNRLDGCEAQDNAWAGFRVIGSLHSLNGVTADSNSWATAAASANVHSGIEIGRDWDGTTASTAGGFDVVVIGAQAWDKNEGSRGRSQRSGIRVRTGARGLSLLGHVTGDPASGTTGHYNVTAGVEFDTTADATHASNYIHGISHRVAS